MKYKIDILITKYNAKEAIKYLFETENIAHQAIITVSYTHLTLPTNRCV